EHAVRIEHAPDGGEGIAKTEIDTAHLLAVGPGALGVVRLACPYQLGKIRIDQAFQCLKGAKVLLANVGFAQLLAILFDGLRFDARDLGSRDLDARPLGAAARPGLVEEAAPAVRRGQAN